MTQAGWSDLFDLVHESIFVRELTGRILSWNTASAKLYGWTANQAVGQDAGALLATEADLPLEAVEAILLAEGAWEGRLRRRTAGGEARVVEARLSLRRDGAGRPAEIVEIGRDLTEGLAAQSALAAAERRYTNLFQAMAASFWELDFTPVGQMLRGLRKQGITDLAGYFEDNPAFVREMMRATRIIDVNEETVKLHGGGDRALLQGSVEPFWPQSSTAVYAASVVAAVSGAPSFSTETRLRRADGGEFEALFTACFAPEAVGRGTLLIGVVDISERVQAQRAERRLRDDFAHSARISMLGELTASIAHEVNQPLAAIATNASANRRWLGRERPDVERALDLTDRIVADARRAADIIDRIRAMASNRPTASAPLAVASVIEEAAGFLHHELQGGGVELHLALDPDAPPVLADRTQLQQVFVNLALNAAQAMSQVASPVAGDPARRIDIRLARDEGAWLRVEVEDTGPGLPAGEADQVFESFFTTKAAGLGMGLPICRSIVEQHGGDIRAGRAAGGGAVFTVRLPALAHTLV